MGVNLNDRIRLENMPGDHRKMIAWLENNVEPANRHNTEGNPVPYHGSATSQVARFAGQTSLWHLEIRGPNLKKVVEILDPKLAVRFAIECYGL